MFIPLLTFHYEHMPVLSPCDFIGAWLLRDMQYMRLVS